MNRSKAISIVLFISGGIIFTVGILWTTAKITPQPKPNTTYFRAISPEGDKMACYVNGSKPLICVPTEMEWN